MIAEAGAGDLIEEHGCIYLYKSERGGEAAARDAAFREKHGVKLERLSAQEVRDLEPHLAPLYRGGIWFKDAYVIASPERLARLLARAIVSRGGQFIAGVACDLRVEGMSAVIRANDKVLSADRVVIAAGAWSRELAAKVGDHVLLDTERGYHVLFPQARELLTRPACYPEHGFYMTPMADGLRAAGTVELGGLEAPANWKRTMMIRKAVKTLVPSAGEGTSEWMGFRPSMPDSLPVIGSSPRTDRVIYAFGHGHLGVTMAGITGQLVSELVTCARTSLDIDPLRSDRTL
ncbi:glycine/D-amino acid oxidase-like deaminating enzyme [Sinorhizobium kostiense]|uniref:Glycine/D-amino acid oxidase-like deaminating enzyme n=1 Tax=Sinorhizobium kostiense TaxID=76747 RepID=A0ABS4QUQ1_9HYPH|nr:glycine/D-amino acid oxidase-like deaminating enzyme [Sinorhizobium kostiense]